MIGFGWFSWFTVVGLVWFVLCLLFTFVFYCYPYASRNVIRFISHATAAARSAAAVACDVDLKAFHDAYIHRIPMHYYNLGWE